MKPKTHALFALLVLTAVGAAPRRSLASPGPVDAFWDPNGAKPLGFTQGTYNGPTYITNFKMNGSTDGVSIGNGNAITYVFGYSVPAANKKLSVWLTVGNNTSMNVASTVPVKLDGKWELTLNPPQAAVAPGGSITTLKFLLCEYVAGTPGVNPLDKATLYCGPWGPGSYSTDYDIKDNGLVVQKQNNNQDRMTRGTLYTTNNTLWLCRGWVFDGPSTPQDTRGYPDTANTWQDWGINPPDHAITTYMIDKTCSENGGAVFCDPAPSIKINSDMQYQDAEFQWVYGGLFCAGPNRSTVTMAAAYRDELTALPVLFEGLFDQPITIQVSGSPPSGCAGTTPAGLAPVAASMVVARQLRKRRQR